MELAEALHVVREDRRLERDIDPWRLSQIRVVFDDPRAKRGEGDSIVSEIGAWSMILSNLIGEIAGWGPEDEDALVNRYEATRVPTFYVYFSSEVVNRAEKSVWQKFWIR